MKNYNFNHPFHLVTSSPWPFFTSFSLMNLLISMVYWMHNQKFLFVILNFFLLCLFLFQWWRDVIREGTFQGCHTKSVYSNLRMGMMCFIISEVFFFFSFFWAYFHSSLSPSIEIGSMWPPKGIICFNPFDIPIFNTVLLISSGFSVTWAHYNMLIDNDKEVNFSLLLTIMLGLIFSLLQGMEYIMSPFSINDSVFGSLFFMLTGFHGLHVLIGTVFLLICYIRLIKGHFSSIRHFGFEAAIWYWHFVDVVWLFLYLLLYCWVWIY